MSWEDILHAIETGKKIHKEKMQEYYNNIIDNIINKYSDVIKFIKNEPWIEIFKQSLNYESLDFSELATSKLNDECKNIVEYAILGGVGLNDLKNMDCVVLGSHDPNYTDGYIYYKLKIVDKDISNGIRNLFNMLNKLWSEYRDRNIYSRFGLDIYQPYDPLGETFVYIKPCSDFIKES